MGHGRMRRQISLGRFGAMAAMAFLALGAYGCAAEVGDEVDLAEIEEFADGEELGPDAEPAAEFCADDTFQITLWLPCPPWTGGGTRKCVDTCVVDRHFAWENGEIVCVTEEPDCTRVCEPCHGAP